MLSIFNFYRFPFKMKKYQLFYSEIKAQLLVVSISIIAITTILLFSIYQLIAFDLESEYISLLILAEVILFITVLGLLLGKYIKVPCEVTLSSDFTFEVQLKKANLFYNFKRIKVPLSHIKKFDQSHANGGPYLSIKLTSPSKTMVLNPKGGLKLFDDFIIEYSSLVSKFNQNQTEEGKPEIEIQSFYDTRGAKVFAMIFLFFLIAIPLSFISDNINFQNNWELVSVYIVGIPFCIRVLRGMFKK